MYADYRNREIFYLPVLSSRQTSSQPLAQVKSCGIVEREMNSSIDSTLTGFLSGGPEAGELARDYQVRCKGTLRGCILRIDRRSNANPSPRYRCEDGCRRRAECAVATYVARKWRGFSAEVATPGRESSIRFGLRMLDGWHRWDASSRIRTSCPKRLFRRRPWQDFSKGKDSRCLCERQILFRQLRWPQFDSNGRWCCGSAAIGPENGNVGLILSARG